MKTIKKICSGLFLLISLLYLFIIISPKIIDDFYPFGIKTSIVLTGSMEPTIKINDFVIVKKATNIQVNDIISYKQQGSNLEVLHRVIRINDNEIVTKGDANNTEDTPINRKQVTGVYVGKIKYFGNLISFISRPIVFSFIMTIFFILLIPTGRRRRKYRSEKEKRRKREYSYKYREGKHSYKSKEE